MHIADLKVQKVDRADPHYPDGVSDELDLYRCTGLCAGVEFVSLFYASHNPTGIYAPIAADMLRSFADALDKMAQARAA